jgi:DNA-binding transcriptional ArsR family regulator
VSGHPDCDPKEAADLLRALAHPMRLTILYRLLDGELPVSGLESELGLKQPSLSQQLGLLREAGLVTTRRQARSVVYGLADQRLHGVLDAVRGYFTELPAALPEPPPRRAALPVLPSNAECGVFAVAGWPDDRTRTEGSDHG